MVSEIADWCGIVGFPLGIAGLVFTFLEARKAKNASAASAAAVEAFRQDQAKVDLVSELHRFIDGTTDIKRMMRAAAFVYIPDRLSELRRFLLSCRTHEVLSDDESQVAFQDAVSYLMQLENAIEVQISKNKSDEPSAPFDPVGEIQELTKIGDAMMKLLIKARFTIGQHDP